MSLGKEGCTRCMEGRRNDSEPVVGAAPWTMVVTSLVRAATTCRTEFSSTSWMASWSFRALMKQPCLEQEAVVWAAEVVMLLHHVWKEVDGIEHTQYIENDENVIALYQRLNKDL